MARETKKISVLWVHNYGEAGGSFMWDIYKHAKRNNNFIKVSLLSIPVMPKLSDVYKMIKKIQKEAISFDIVHAQCGSLVGFLSSLTKKTFILTLRGSDLYGTSERGFKGRILSILRVMMTYFACLRATYIIVMSNHMKKRLQKFPFVKRNKILIITDPASRDLFSFNINKLDRPVYLLYSSIKRRNPVKREDFFNRAILLAKKSNINISVNYIYSKPREYVIDMIKSSDVTILTSRHEGWPNIIKETLLLSKNFISTPVSDLEMFAGHETGNFIIETEEELAMAIEIIQFNKCIDKDSSMIKFSFWHPISVFRRISILYHFSLYKKDIEK